MKIIGKIQIKHFRSIYECDLNSIGDFNVFAGSNDSGKSNVLKALNLFFNNQTSFLDEFKFENDYSKLSLLRAREMQKGKQYISIRIFLNPDAIKGKDSLKKLARTKKELWIERTWWKYEEQYKEKIPNYIEKSSQGIKGSFRMLINEMRFVYIPAFKNERVFSHVLKLAGDTEGIFLNQSAKNRLNKTITGTTAEISSDFSELTGINTKLSLPITLESFWSALTVASVFEEAGNKKLTRGKEDDYYIDFSLRGEGIKSIFIPVILGWLSRGMRTKYWIWGVDEPENSLESSRALNLFSKFIEYSSSAQIFVSSHSPIFIFPQEEKLGKLDINVYLTRQNQEGDTKIKVLEKISDGEDSIDKLSEEFGVDYISFLELQKTYAQNIQKQERELLFFKKIISEIKKPEILVEGEFDEIYLKRAIEIYNYTYPATVTWVGKKDGGGQGRFTGKGALDKVCQTIESNPNLINKKLVLFYDIDCNKTTSIIKRNLIVYCPQRITSAKLKSGIEHLLNLPDDFDINQYYKELPKKNDDKIFSLQKDKLSQYFLSLSASEQTMWLKNIINILEEIKNSYLNS
jgi:hypothetical protein